MSVRLSLLLLGTTLLVGCGMSIPLPPRASFDSPLYKATPIAATAWLKKVDITDQEMSHPESRALIESSLTNNLLRFLRETNYFRQVELLPGKPQLDDRVLHFEFDRYRQERKTGAWSHYDVSDLSGTLTVTRPDGRTITEVKTEVKEQHPAGGWGNDPVFPTGTKARTQLIEKLLWKALSGPSPSP